MIQINAELYKIDNLIIKFCFKFPYFNIKYV